MTTRTERGVETPKKVSWRRRRDNSTSQQWQRDPSTRCIAVDALRFVIGLGFLKTGGRKGRSYGCKRSFRGFGKPLAMKQTASKPLAMLQRVRRRNSSEPEAELAWLTSRNDTRCATYSAT